VAHNGKVLAARSLNRQIRFRGILARKILGHDKHRFTQQMVIDSSALLAILQNAPERRAFNESIEAAEQVLLSAASFVEISMCIESRFGAEGVRDLEDFIAKARIVLIAVDEEQAHLAAQAYRRYGEERHPAALNFCDCFAYALTRAQQGSLLFKGRDFSHTDLDCHPASSPDSSGISAPRT
jgi:ribonuclease VapC